MVSSNLHEISERNSRSAIAHNDYNHLSKFKDCHSFKRDRQSVIFFKLSRQRRSVRRGQTDLQEWRAGGLYLTLGLVAGALLVLTFQGFSPEPEPLPEPLAGEE
ncbi:glr3455 [Gloeobacter violaceus PCC 7421]|uniref:Glr3455 protein n=1 Tax=Gloeobacter violaceus (strain ATCC 29082 / PCC 7421) TaxID=251221 RepID=Q7NFR9_GLOVI|nr:glr3455 [Gloeobacter violaceus PCC 7421]